MDSEIFRVTDKDNVLSNSDFRFFQQFIFELAGISLSDRKIDLVSSRLGRHLKASQLGSFSDYRRLLEDSLPGSLLRQEFINLLTTNKTEFFREPEHFHFLKNKLVPKWIKENRNDLTLWSSAASTGEEAYSLSLLIGSHAPLKTSFKILATDIDTKVLETAKQGVYRNDRLNEIPEEYRQGNLRSGSGSADGWFRIENHIHDRVVFKQHNLTENTYPGDAMFDVIFCRNVLIYFSSETIRTLMEKLHRSLKVGGVLVISHSESISGCQDLYKTVQPSIFQKI